MIILLRKKSVKWLLALAAAIVIFSIVSGGMSRETIEDSEPTAAVMAQAVLEELASAEADAKGPEAEVIVPQADPLAETEKSEPEPVPEAEETPMTAAPAADDPAQKVIALRMERSQNRAQQKEQLEAIVANSEVSEQTKARAEEKLLKLAETSAVELETETLLKTKGYEQSVVMVDDKRATVYITSELAPEDYDKIGDLVQSSTNFSLEQIIIIPK